jgi:transcription antitermination factor NusG
MAAAESNWYAVYTWSRHERPVAERLEGQAIRTFLPLCRRLSTRKDRQKFIEVPALPGYVLVQCTLHPETRALIKKTTGVVRLVEYSGRPATIPAEQVDGLRNVLIHAADCWSYSGTPTGPRVRLVKGPNAGVEGRLVTQQDGTLRVVVRLDHVPHSVSVEVEVADLECIW